MARYIDLDKAIEDVESVGAYYSSEEEVKEQCLIELKGQPIADVVPKSEVAQEIFEEIEREINDAMQSNYKVLPQIEESEALWNRVNGKIDALRCIDGFIEELKKKYTEV